VRESPETLAPFPGRKIELKKPLPNFFFAHLATLKNIMSAMEDIVDPDVLDSIKYGAEFLDAQYARDICAGLGITKKNLNRGTIEFINRGIEEMKSTIAPKKDYMLRTALLGERLRGETKAKINAKEEADRLAKEKEEATKVRAKAKAKAKKQRQKMRKALEIEEHLSLFPY
jgi:L-rhamnose isomerase